ncbi:MAG: helix-turn-helix transcriptional regulator [Halanaeroarchaeum sp.]
MRRAALLALAVLGLLVVPALGSAQTQPTDGSVDTRIRIAVQESGDARWAVSVRFPLETANDTAAFDRLRTEFTDGDGEGYLTVTPFRQAASRVSERTDQEMRIVAVNRSATVVSANDTAVGRLTLAFTWTNFARIGEERVRVGEAFEGGWFGDLGSDQTLVIEPPPGYKVHNVEPLQAIVNGTLRWEGPQTFGPGQPVMTFVPIPAGPTPLPLPFTASVFLGLGVVLGVLLYVAYRQEWVGGGTPSTEESPDANADEGTEPNEEPPPESDRTEPEATPSTEPDRELLSDEERVERIVREHGGRMKQAQIVEETRWSNAKVSQLLSSMADEGRVEKLRIGRENLISLPEEDEE